MAPVNLLCQLVGITRSAYYKAAQRQKQNDSRDKIILEEVKRIRKNLPKLGTRKVYYRLKPFLKKLDIKMGRDKLFSLLKANGMLAERRKRIAFTTESRHYLFKYPNLVKDMEPNKPHQLWVSDMTYLRTGRGFSYLSLITDAYSRKIVGWSLQRGCPSLPCMPLVHWKRYRWLSDNSPPLPWAASRFR